MVVKVTSRREIGRFVRFGIDLYADDPHFIPPILAVFAGELRREILRRRTGVGLLYLDGGRVLGRLFYSFSHDAKNGRDVCYFAHFESVEDDLVASELFAAMEADMRARGVVHAEGSYAPYDPDTRRGILVEGFDDDPAFLLSYNKPYYGPMLERLGFAAVTETVAFSGIDNETSRRALKALGARFDARHGVDIDPLEFRHLDRDIADVHRILLAATTEINYREAPSLAMIAGVAKQLRFFLDPRFVLIARRHDDGEPLGFVLVIPDFNEILKTTKGRIRPLVFLFGKRRITRVRAMMQYVVPAWQNTGLVFRLYEGIEQRMHERGIVRLEGGTIVRENFKSFSSFVKLGCRLTKTMRLYGKDLTP
jgi:GNAT superfamily N-acetyltransferase